MILDHSYLLGIFALDLSHLDGCGVRECSEEGETWLCVLVRYPLMNGLKLPEDKVIDIKCKPQDSRVQGENEINFQKNM